MFGRRSRFRSLIGGTVEFLAMCGAAVRVANAVEAHAAPARRDLRRLGIERLPRVW
jgi:hypothetical protein